MDLDDTCITDSKYSNGKRKTGVQRGTESGERRKANQVVLIFGTFLSIWISYTFVSFKLVKSIIQCSPT